MWSQAGVSKLHLGQTDNNCFLLLFVVGSLGDHNRPARRRDALVRMYRKQFRRFRNDCKNAQNFPVYLENVSRVLFMSTAVPEKVVLIPDGGYY